MVDKERRDAGVKSVHLTIDILEAIAEREGDIGVSELALQLGTTKGTAFRHLQTLLERGYIVQDELTQRYNLGAQAAVLGKIAAERVNIVSASRVPLATLRDETSETSVLSIVDNQGIVVLNTHLGKSPLEIGVRTGSRLALHSTAQGKIVLAFGPSMHLTQLRRRGLERYTDRTITDLDALERNIAQVRATGIADAPSEETVGMNAIAGPIFDGIGRLAATIAIVGSVQNIDRDQFQEQAVAVARAAEVISIALGHRVPLSRGRAHS